MERKASGINNAFYDSLNEGWLSEMDHPIALLRAENATRNPWIEQVVAEQKKRVCKILDIGCGAGLLTNPLSEKGHTVTGIDLSEGSLQVAKKNDTAGKVHYIKASAEKLPFENESFDVVCAMDLLEHVEDAQAVIEEASRVLKKEGLFFFHTFNQSWLSYLIIIKGVEWFVKNAPKNMHVYSLFIKPSQLKQYCKKGQLEVQEIQGLVPDYTHPAFWKMLLTRKIHPHFRFRFINSLKTGYVGYAKKN